MKKVICGVLVAVMLAPAWCVHAEEAKEKVKTVSLLKDEEKNTYTLSLEAAKNMALKNNGQIEAVEFKKKGFDISLDSAKITKAKYKDAAISVVGGSSGLLIKKGYYVEMYKVQSSLASLEKEKIISIRDLLICFDDSITEIKLLIVVSSSTIRILFFIINLLPLIKIYRQQKLKLRTFL